MTKRGSKSRGVGVEVGDDVAARRARAPRHIASPLPRQGPMLGQQRPTPARRGRRGRAATSAVPSASRRRPPAPRRRGRSARAARIASRIAPTVPATSRAGRTTETPTSLRARAARRASKSSGAEAARARPGVGAQVGGEPVAARARPCARRSRPARHARRAIGTPWSAQRALERLVLEGRERPQPACAPVGRDGDAEGGPAEEGVLRPLAGAGPQPLGAAAHAPSSSRPSGATSMSACRSPWHPRPPGRAAASASGGGAPSRRRCWR